MYALGKELGSWYRYEQTDQHELLLPATGCEVQNKISSGFWHIEVTEQGPTDHLVVPRYVSFVWSRVSAPRQIIIP
jgi:hypothetical protein